MTPSHSLEKIKVVYVITALNTGGAELALLRMLENLDLSKFSPYVISITSRGEIGALIQSINIPLMTLDLNGWWSFPGAMIRLLNFLNKIKPEIVHTWLYHADLLGGLVAMLARVPVIVWSIRSSNFLNRDTKNGTRIIFKLCIFFSKWVPHLVIYNSWVGLDFHKNYGYQESKNLVISNGVDLTKFKPNRNSRHEVRNNLGLDKHAILIGVIGRFDPLKNQIGFIEAAKHLFEIMPDVHFVMAGKDCDWNNIQIQKQLSGLSVAKNFHLLGLLQLDISLIIPALDLMTLASVSEACPNILLEAMACEVPCVSTNAGDSSIIIGNPAWVVPVGDMLGLAKKIKLFLDLDLDDKKYIRLKARERMANHFEISNMVRLYEAQYIDLVNLNGLRKSKR